MILTKRRGGKAQEDSTGGRKTNVSGGMGEKERDMSTPFHEEGSGCRGEELGPYLKKKGVRINRGERGARTKRKKRKKENRGFTSPNVFAGPEGEESRILPAGRGPAYHGGREKSSGVENVPYRWGGF